jgi:ribosomal protein S3
MHILREKHNNAGIIRVNVEKPFKKLEIFVRNALPSPS